LNHSGNESPVAGFTIGATMDNAFTTVSTGYGPYFSPGDTLQQNNMVMEFDNEFSSSPVSILRPDDIFEVYLRPEIDIHIADNVADDIEIDLPEGWITISSPGKVILTRLYDEDENAS